MYDLIDVRAKAIAEAVPKAFVRVLTAQKRDAIRYIKVRRHDTPPRVNRFAPGSYVYMSQKPLNTFDVKSTRTILRVQRVTPHGVITLEGADGQAINTRIENCAPCQIPNLITDVMGTPADFPCSICHSPSLADPMLLCDTCYRGCHLQCLDPLLKEVPEGEWQCPSCIAAKPPPARPQENAETANPVEESAWGGVSAP